MTKNVILTGASKGIGRATAIKLSQLNCNLALISRDKTKLEETKKICENNNIKCNIFTGDLTDVKFLNETSLQIIEIFNNKIDVLINNAGMAIFKNFLDITYEDLIKQLNLNFVSLFLLTQNVVPSMIKRNEGLIINISSLAGKNGFVEGTAYSATKHAVMGFSKSLMLELRKYNIKVAAICPGSTSTDMILNTSMSPKSIDKILKPEDVAETIAFLLSLTSRANVSEIDIRPTNP
jgi:3-oxoacyl-[acyl-carrier protein] reductase